MSAPVVSLINMKGGVGKTTLTFFIAASVARYTGKNLRVLCIDLDPQANLTSHMLEPTLLGHLPEINVSKFFLGRTKLSQHVFQTKFENVNIIPSHVDLAMVEKALLSNITAPLLLANNIQPLTQSFDLILIDCPPSLGVLTANGIIASKYVLIPITPDAMALSGLLHTLETIEQCRHFNPQLAILSIVPNMIDRRYTAHNMFLDLIYKNPPAPIRFEPLTRRAALQRAMAVRKNIFTEIDNADPECKKELTDFIFRLMRLLHLDEAGE